MHGKYAVLINITSEVSSAGYSLKLFKKQVVALIVPIAYILIRIFHFTAHISKGRIGFLKR